MNRYKTEKTEMRERLLQGFMAVAVLIALLIFAEGIAAQAATGAVSVESVNYDDSTITIKMSSADHMIFLSNATQKKWEYVPAVITDKGSYKLATMDISWVSMSTNFVMSFKGDVSSEPIKVTIPKRDNSLKVTYNMGTGKMSFTNAGTKTVEWKKRDSMTWSDYNEQTFEAALAAFIDNGASLMFRVKGVNGTGTDAGSRPGKEVTVNIPKKSTAPTIVIDDSKMSLALKKGMAYRYVDENGYPVNEQNGWTEITSDCRRTLADIAPNAMYDKTEGRESEDVYIQFYKKATSSSQMSKYRTIKIPAQPSLSSADLSSDNSMIEYTSASSFKLTFKTAGENNVLEYCIITKSMQDYGVRIEDISNDSLTWTEVTSQTPIVKSKETDPKLTEGTLIYFRKKAVKSLGDEGYRIASPAELLGTVSYPKGAATAGFKLLKTIEGMCKDGSNTLPFSFTSDTRGEIDTIQFRTSGGNAMGTAKFTVTIDELQDKTYNYNVKLTDVSGITRTDDTLYAFIYFKGEPTNDPTKASIRSSEEGGIGLYIYPKSGINNPSNIEEKKHVADKLSWNSYDPYEDQIGFTTAIKRVYLSNLNDDQKDFRFKIDMGTLNVPELDNGSEANAVMAVSKIRYDGVELTEDTDFTVEYYEDKNSNNKAYRAAVVTLHADKIEQKAAIDDRDKDTPVYIYLNNGEVISAGVTMNLQRTAAAQNNPSFTYTLGSLEPYITIKTTDSNGTTTEKTERNLDVYHRITLTIPAKLGNKNDYDVSVQTVTWDGTNISLTATKNGNTIEIVLDDAVLNEMPGKSITTTVTKPIVIEFSNGYVISSGITMTVNPAHNNNNN
ncbi:MAG: hypothetical protein II694_08545 [Lachnospiraceae bacterium]|nr:hypothetical protein [Lachnospiraceae bacterium]